MEDLSKKVMTALLEAATKAAAEGLSNAGKGGQGSAAEALKKGAGDFLMDVDVTFVAR